MAAYDVKEPDFKYECPYDKTHMIELKRLPYHLMKCRKNHPHQQMVSCPFNALHEIPKPELRYHMSDCPDRHMIAQDLTYAGQKKEKWGGNTKLPKDDWVPPPSEEDWEADGPQFQKFSFEQPAKKSLAGMSVAEKKAYHTRNRINYQRRMQGLPPLPDDEPLPQEVRVPSLPTQTGKPSAFAMARQQVAASGNVKMAGIGRGTRIVAPVSMDSLSLTSGFSGTSNGTQDPVPRGPRPSAEAQAMKKPAPQSHTAMAGVQQPSALELLRAQALAQQSMMGRGRGLGRGSMMMQNGGSTPPPGSPVRNGSFGRGRGSPIHRNGSTNSSPNRYSSQDSDEGLDAKDEIKKEVRRLKKKLNMIEVLEDRRASGIVLSKEEEEKVSKKPEIIYQIESLSLD